MTMIICLTLGSQYSSKACDDECRKEKKNSAAAVAVAAASDIPLIPNFACEINFCKMVLFLPERWYKKKHAFLDQTSWFKYSCVNVVHKACHSKKLKWV